MRGLMQLRPLEEGNSVHSSTVNYGGVTTTTILTVVDTNFVLDTTPIGSPLGNSLVWTFSE